MENVSDVNKAKKEDWAYGEVEWSGTKGSFPLDCIYIIPTLEKPPEDFLVSQSVCSSHQVALNHYIL